MKKSKKYKIEETRTRSLLKGISFKIFEIAFDTAVIFAITNKPLESLGISLLLETSCFFWHYLNERLWNRIDLGRKIKREQQRT